MADPVIRLDKSKPYSTNHGDMHPDDPCYRVVYWQGGKMGGKMISLPFDTHGELVPDDGKTEPFMGLGVNQKGDVVQVKYHPLYDADRRAYLKAKQKRAADLAAKKPDASELEEDAEPSEIEELEGSAEDNVDFAAWLRGEQNYPAHMVRAAARKRLNKNYTRIVPDLVVDLVRDEQIVPEDQVSQQYKAVLKKHDQSMANAA